MFAQNQFQYLIQVMQLGGGGFKSLYKSDGSGEFMWGEICISMFALYKKICRILCIQVRHLRESLFLGLQTSQ